jgi:lysine-specific demethylase/histidyl-hydroxylase NO66
LVQSVFIKFGRSGLPQRCAIPQDGCSLRLLNPQTFCEPVWRMLSVLQEFFTSGMGANIYFTPANTQAGH